MWKTRSDSPWGRIGRAVVDLLRAWWGVDRIRIAPGQGRLLRIEPPCIVSIDGRPLEIVGRTVGRTPAFAYILYDCRTAGGAAQLQVRIVDSETPVEVTWREAGQTRSIDEDDVEIWGEVG